VLCINSNTVVDGRAAHMTDTTWQSAPEHPPYQIMLDPSLITYTFIQTQLRDILGTKLFYMWSGHVFN
jgi:hypothetical protein